MELNRIALKIPPFYPSDPEMWFNMVERSFEASGVTLEATKFSHILGALDPIHAKEIRDIVFKPPTTDPYTFLRAELIKILSTTQEQKTRRLLEHEETGGDHKPTQFL